jgi:NADPH:quinone reductase-like Zn-dependent oxidoreductase
MKAIRVNKFGGLEVMTLQDIAQPFPAPDEILVKVHPSVVNLLDATIRSGKNDALKTLMPLPFTLGWDEAGIVEQTGTM